MTSILDAHAQNEDYWNGVYDRAASPMQPSSFAETVVARRWIAPDTDALIDLGCGTARDTAYVAQHRAGLGLDYSHVITEKNRRYWATHSNLSFEQADVRDAAALENIIRGFVSANGGKVALYSRFFLHAIDEGAEAGLLTALSNSLTAGSQVLLEFRTHLDRDLGKIFDDHYRRFVDPDAFLERFRAVCRAQVLHKEAGRGLAPYKDEDPHVARLVLEVQ